MWTWSWAIRNIIAELLMPPAIWIVSAFLSILLFRNKPKLKNTLLVLSLICLWITSTTAFANWFTQITDAWVQWPQAVDIQKLAIGENSKGPDSPRAIVILGGGVRHGALDTPEYLQQDVSKETMERLRLGVRLAKKTHLPLLVTGGAPDAYQKGLQSEGELMSEVLLEEFGIKPRWVENQSRTTEENAKFSAAILKEQNINSVYLVTHFWHMRRSQEIFQKYGILVKAISCGYYYENKYIHNQLSPIDFLPSSSGFTRTRQIWHELIGNIWYKSIYGLRKNV